MKRVVFITGSDTSVGKTVLAVLLTRHLRRRGEAVRAVKPFCSGGLDDVRALQAAQEGALDREAICPWVFRRPLTPLLAARCEGRRVEMAAVVRFLRQAASGHGTLLVEGAGGLLSPLGEGFSALDLIRSLRATPVVVCPNRLGALNQARLVLAALPGAIAARARCVLVEPPCRDAASRTNPALLGECIGADRVIVLPRFRGPAPPEPDSRLDRILARILAPTVHGACPGGAVGKG